MSNIKLKSDGLEKKDIDKIGKEMDDLQKKIDKQIAKEGKTEKGYTIIVTQRRKEIVIEKIKEKLKEWKILSCEEIEKRMEFLKGLNDYLADYTGILGVHIIGKGIGKEKEIERIEVMYDKNILKVSDEELHVISRDIDSNLRMIVGLQNIIEENEECEIRKMYS